METIIAGRQIRVVRDAARAGVDPVLVVAFEPIAETQAARIAEAQAGVVDFDVAAFAARAKCASVAGKPLRRRCAILRRRPTAVRCRRGSMCVSSRSAPEIVGSQMLSSVECERADAPPLQQRTRWLPGSRPLALRIICALIVRCAAADAGQHVERRAPHAVDAGHVQPAVDDAETPAVVARQSVRRA